MSIFPITKLIGKRLCIWRRAANMLNIQFGLITIIKRGSIGEIGLHVQCPWRLMCGRVVVTGSGDLYVPENNPENFDWVKWFEEATWEGNLMEKKILALLKGFDESTMSIINRTKQFVVVDAIQRENGDLSIFLSEDYSIKVFVHGTANEQYRMLEHKIKKQYVFPDESAQHSDDPQPAANADSASPPSIPPAR